MSNACVMRLELAGLRFECQVATPIRYKALSIQNAYRIDLVVQGALVVELKSVERVLDLHVAQALSYMKFGGFSLGLLINFNVPLLRNGIKRLVL